MISLPRGKTLRLAKKREKRVLGALNRGYKSFVHTVTYAQLLKLSSVLVESKLEIELEIASQLSVNAWKNFDSSLRRSPQCLLSFQGNFKIKDILLGLTDDHYGQISIKIVSFRLQCVP